MKSLTTFTNGCLSCLFLVFIISTYACKPDHNMDTSKNSADLDSASDHDTPSASAVPDNAQEVSYLQENERLYPWVDKLNLRKDPTTRSKVITSVTPSDILTYMGEKSEKSNTIVLRGVAYQEPWLKVSTPKGVEGWVYGGAVKRRGEQKGNSPMDDFNFQFPYFGSYNLKDWKRIDERDASGGDAEITVSTFQKKFRILEVTQTSVGDYGYTRQYIIKDIDGKRLRKREFKFIAEAGDHQLQEEVINYKSTPPMRYHRSQNLDQHYTALSSKPIMVNGTWSEEVYQEPEADQPVSIDILGIADCQRFLQDDSGCSCTFHPEKDNYKTSIFRSDQSEPMKACMKIDGQVEILSGQRPDVKGVSKNVLNMHFYNRKYDVYITEKAMDRADEGSPTYQGILEIKSKKGISLGSRSFYGSCGC